MGSGISRDESVSIRKEDLSSVYSLDKGDFLMVRRLMSAQASREIKSPYFDAPKAIQVTLKPISPQEMNED
ncbi:hypothetical protein CR513_04979, partial [Mucuna pruriens]